MCKKINTEYQDVLLKNLTSNVGEKFLIIDTLDFLGGQFCTYADSKFDEKTGEEIPTETVLTHQIEHFSF